MVRPQSSLRDSVSRWCHIPSDKSLGYCRFVPTRLLPHAAASLTAAVWHIRPVQSRGMKLQQIARELNAQGVVTKTSNSARWTHQAVAQAVVAKEFMLRLQALGQAGPITNTSPPAATMCRNSFF